MNAVLGWDIGGAHVKAVLVDDDGQVRRVWHRAAPLWRGLADFTKVVREIREEADPELRHAVTMTGELTDIFPTRTAGVRLIAESLQETFPDETFFYFSTGPAFVEEPGASAHLVGSMNWYASAKLVARLVGDGVFVDLGSTTTDLIRLREGAVEAVGFTDAQRLASQELLYTGVARTPLMSLAARVEVDGGLCNLAAEHFATTADVYNLLGQLPDSLRPFETADGAGCSSFESARRVARMIGRDCEDEDDADAWVPLARAFAELQQDRILENLQTHVAAGASGVLVGAGTGRFLLPAIAPRCGLSYQDIDHLLAPRLATREAFTPADCVAAYAVAELFRLEHASG